MRRIERLKNGLEMDVDERFSVCEDALLLADFAAVKRTERVADIGAGCGTMLFWLIDRGYGGACTALEIDPSACALMHATVRRGSCANMDIVQGDAREHRSPHGFDCVLCNPPYFAPGTGKTPRDAVRARMRSEQTLSLADAAHTAARLLKQRGRLALCCRPERLCDAFGQLRASRLEPKRLRFVKRTADAAPWLALIDARLDAAPGLAVLGDLVQLDADGSPAAEYAAILSPQQEEHHADQARNALCGRNADRES